MVKNVNGAGLNGPRGLIVAVILKSVDDLNHPKFRADALEFFQGNLYQHYLELLDLPPTLKPVALKHPASRC